MAWGFAIAVLLVLVYFFPGLMRYVLVALAIVLAGVIYWVVQNDREVVRQKKLVTITIAGGAPDCPADKPLSITFKNGSTQTVRRVEFRVEGFRKNHSEAVYVSTSYLEYSSDRILNPGETWRNCWKRPKARLGLKAADLEGFALKDLVWKPREPRITFR